MTLREFTEPSLLIPHLEGSDQAVAINTLSHRLQLAGRVDDSLAFFQAVLQRDYLASSVTENGVAFPHARSRDVQHLSFALGLSDAGIRWRDGASVRAVFLIAVPPADVQLYLALVGALTRLVRTEDRLHRLLASALPDQLLRVLNEVTVHLPANLSLAGHTDKS